MLIAGRLKKSKSAKVNRKLLGIRKMKCELEERNFRIKNEAIESFNLCTIRFIWQVKSVVGIAYQTTSRHDSQHY